MPAPTRPQITAPVTLPTYLVEYNTGSGWTAVAANWVLGVSGLSEITGGGSGLGFGSDAQASFDVELDVQALSIAWDGTAVRVSYGFDTSSQVMAATGTIHERKIDNEASITWTVVGFHDAIGKTAIYSPLLRRRPIATQTTATSVEDPSNGAWLAGLINYIFWQSGGRPYEQAGSYPNATFYYSCDASVIAPEWTWISGEQAWDELKKLAAAGGGQIFQTADGVMRYGSPLSYVGTAAYTFDTSTFDSITEQASRAEKVTSVRCAFIGRRLQPLTVVYEDKTPRLIAIGASITVTLDIQQPVYDYDLDFTTNPPSLKSESLVFSRYDGQLLAYTTQVTQYVATRVAITITNTSGEVGMISHLMLKGHAIAPTSQGIATYGTGQPERDISQDVGVYVQSQLHAERLCRMVKDFYQTARPTRVLSGCGYDPDRQVGETVNLTYAPWGLSAAPHRIIGIRHADTGATMEVTLVDSSGLIGTANVFIVGTSYAPGTVRQLSY